MSKLIVNAFLTLDGVMQAPGGPDEDREGGFEHGGWQFPYTDDVTGKLITDGFADADGFLLGRKTYQIFAGYWPKVTDPNNPVAAVETHDLVALWGGHPGARRRGRASATSAAGRCCPRCAPGRSAATIRVEARSTPTATESKPPNPSWSRRCEARLLHGRLDVALFNYFGVRRNDRLGAA
jgi:hypothetical protein